MIFVVALEERNADDDVYQVQIAIVKANSPSEAISKAMDLTMLENVVIAKILCEFSNTKDCVDTIIATIRTPHVHVDVW